ncbi:MAG: ABC transporter permease [Acidimicrobiia bacterium]
MAARLWEMTLDGEVYGHLSTSLINLAIGFTLSLVVGVTVGILMARVPLIEAALDTYVYAFLTAPVLVFAPIFFAIFGLGRQTIVAVIVTYTIFVIIINTHDGIKAAPRDLIEMAESFNASKTEIVRSVVVPAAGPAIMAGVRLGMGRAIKGMVNGEMFIAVVGLGGFVRRAGQSFDSETVLATVLLIVCVALLISAVIQLVDRRVNFWLPSRLTGW